MPLSQQVHEHKENRKGGGEVLSVHGWQEEDGGGGGQDCVLLKQGGGGWWGQCIQPAIKKALVASAIAPHILCNI